MPVARHVVTMAAWSKPPAIGTPIHIGPPDPDPQRCLANVGTSSRSRTLFPVRSTAVR
jgi:hypothetical protein